MGRDLRTSIKMAWLPKTLDSGEIIWAELYLETKRRRYLRLWFVTYSEWNVVSRRRLNELPGPHDDPSIKPSNGLNLSFR